MGWRCGESDGGRSANDPPTLVRHEPGGASVGPRTETLPEGKHLKLVNVELFQSINPGLIILFAPLMVGFWQLLARRKREPSISRRKRSRLAWKNGPSSANPRRVARKSAIACCTGVFVENVTNWWTFRNSAVRRGGATV